MRASVCLMAFLLLGGVAHADHGPVGLGVVLGSPTGVSGKLYLTGNHAIDVAVGAEFLNAEGFELHADYLWHPLVLTQEEAFTMPFYFGIGGRFLQEGKPADQSDLHLGVRVPAGILFDFKTIPIDVFLEVAIVLDVFEGNDLGDRRWVDFNAGVGVRYYF